MDANGNIITHTSFADIVAYVIGILNSIVFVLASLALLLFLWGVFKYVYTAGAKKNRKAMLWGLIALFVLFSIWGILRLACDSLLAGSSCGSSTGTIGGTGVIY